MQPASSLQSESGLVALRDAVLRDLEHIPEVDFDRMTAALLPSVPEALDTAIRARLRKDSLLDEHGWWTTFDTRGSGGTTVTSEIAMFESLESIILAIFDVAALHQCRKESLLTYVDNGEHDPFSQRTGSSRPDAYLRLRQSIIPGRSSSERAAWADVAVSFEFRRGQNDQDVFDVRSDLAFCGRSVLCSMLMFLRI